ncbi:hypothetical protein [Geoalkalibacter halelectricus]|uniref:hypothetical protein n=1 Tax=Geoalkalibacter halelectricus TaxID=2847045 RepID=UPI00266EE081|nr:hypothetical protein [Geoalkalibacter halelectricus]
MKEVADLLDVKWMEQVIADNRVLAKRELGVDIVGQPKRMSVSEHCWQGRNGQSWTIYWPDEIRRAVLAVLEPHNVYYLDDVPQGGELTAFCFDGLLRIDYRLRRNDIVFGWGDGKGQHEVIGWHSLNFL